MRLGRKVGFFVVFALLFSIPVLAADGSVINNVTATQSTSYVEADIALATKNLLHIATGVEVTFFELDRVDKSPGKVTYTYRFRGNTPEGLMGLGKVVVEKYREHAFRFVYELKSAHVLGLFSRSQGEAHIIGLETLIGRKKPEGCQQEYGFNLPFRCGPPLI